MFRLARFLLFLAIAFMAGLFYERGQQRELCDTLDGDWTNAGLCVLKD